MSSKIFENYLDVVVLVIDGMQMTKKRKGSEAKARFLAQEVTEDLIMLMTNRTEVLQSF